MAKNELDITTLTPEQRDARLALDVERLLRFGRKHKLIKDLDVLVARNTLLDLLALAAALMWAVYSILVKRYTERYDNFLVTRRVFLWAFLTSLPLVLLTDGLPSLTPLFTQPNILISWLFLGVFGNAVCFAIWNIAFKRLGVVVTNNYLYASPFVTVVVGWLLLDEKISWMSILGAVLITLGVVFANKSTEK